MSVELDNFLSAQVIKRSVSISGHMTSVSLEQPFWDYLNKFAEVDKVSLSSMIVSIDEKRQTNLSSALRLYVLYRLKSAS